MRFLSAVIVIASISLIRLGFAAADESNALDRATTDRIRQAIEDLENPKFERREAASDLLSKQGPDAIPALIEAAEKLSAEASVRIFSVLQRMYFEDEDTINEAVELAFQRLKQSEKLDVAARAVRSLDNNAETRQKRAIPLFEKYGGIISFQEQDADRQVQVRPTIAYIMVPRGWTGGNEGLKVLTRIEEIRQHSTQLYIIRGVDIAEEALLDLAAELPFLDIKQRGPAKLGIRNKSQVKGAPVLIEHIDPDSAAERAGLKAGDRILKIDGKEVDSFDRLIEVIGEREPGDRVPIFFVRDEQKQSVDAVLLPWGSKKQDAAKGIPPKQEGSK